MRYFLLVLTMVCALMTACEQMPYGLEHTRLIEAAPLSSEILAWEKRGARTNELPLMEYTNSRNRLKNWPTNVVVGGRAFEILLALESKGFRGKGMLLGARSGVVIWQGTNGALEVLNK